MKMRCLFLTIFSCFMACAMDEIGKDPSSETDLLLLEHVQSDQGNQEQQVKLFGKKQSDNQYQIGLLREASIKQGDALSQFHARLAKIEERIGTGGKNIIQVGGGFDPKTSGTIAEHAMRLASLEKTQIVFFGAIALLVLKITFGTLF